MPLSPELLNELKEAYSQYASVGPITRENLGEVFKASGSQLPPHRIRELMDNKSKSKTDEINFEEFTALFEELDLDKTKASLFKSKVKKRDDVIKYESGHAEGTLHTSTEAEKRSFTNYINAYLVKDPECKGYLPISHVEDDLFKKCTDGILICKLINNAVPGTVDERALNKKKLTTFTMSENCTLAVHSSSAIGCHVVNIHAEDIKQCTPHLVLGLLWQIIKIGLFSKINIKATPNLLCLLQAGETVEHLLSLSPEDLLLRWVNYQLEKAGSSNRVTNFTTDLMDSTSYSILFDQILDGKAAYNSQKVYSENDMEKRAEMIIRNAHEANIPALVHSQDIVTGNQKLNMAFIAELFNMYPSLAEVENAVEIIETREEKSYRNWMNSLGVNPSVHDLYQDISNGVVLLQLLEMLKADCVDWAKVNKPPYKPLYEKLKKVENCNKVVDIAKQMNFSTVGLSGKDIADSSKMHALSVVWQMMSRYTMKILQELSGTSKPITDSEILKWANDKLSSVNITLSGFKDSSLSGSEPIFELIDSIKPKTVNREYISKSNDTEEKLSNAKYAISLARKIGASVFALPEDIVELKNKMIMSIFACLMIVDLQR